MSVAKIDNFVFEAYMIISLVTAIAVCLSIIVLAIVLPQIKIGKISVDTYWLAAFVGAAVILISGSVNIGELLSKMTDNSSVNPIKILVLFISMTLISVILDEVGFFRYLAGKSVALAKHSQLRLFVILYLTVSLLTIFTSNDIIVLTFTPFICYFAKNANIDPRPYLFAEFAAANTMSMTFIIGNPTNIYIATSYGVTFAEYASTMIFPTLAGGVVAFLALLLIFRKSLSAPVSVSEEKVTIENKPLLAEGLIDLSICTLFLAFGSYIGVEMWLVSFISVVLLIIAALIVSAERKRKPVELKNALKRAPWQLIPFVLSMFVIILGLTQNGVTDALNSWLGSDNTVWKYGISSFLSSNLINNIPMSVLFCPIIQPLTASGAETVRQAVYATVVGSNIGAYLTPVGALAGIMWLSLLKKHGVKFGYADFIKYGVLVSLPSLAATLLVLSLIL